jgi:hypothetical protein
MVAALVAALNRVLEDGVSALYYGPQSRVKCLIFIPMDGCDGGAHVKGNIASECERVTKAPSYLRSV